MTVEEIKNGVGRTVRMHWGKHGRIIAVNNTFVSIDFPEDRSFYTNGKLMEMPVKRIHFKTRNQVWHINKITAFADDYVFKLKVYKQNETVNISGVVPDKNELPEIKF